MVTEELTFKCSFISKRPGVKKKENWVSPGFHYLSQSGNYSLHSPAKIIMKSRSKMFDNRPIALSY